MAAAPELGSIPSASAARPVVLYQTPWRRLDDGWSIAARAYARAMALGGLDVHLIDWAAPLEDVPAVVADDVVDEVRDFLQPAQQWDCRVLSCVVSATDHMRRILGGQSLGRGPQGFHCVFERQQVEPELAELLNQLEGVWAQCSANRDVLKRAGVHRVALIPHPYFDSDPQLRIPPPRESRRFYWIGRFEPRKAPDLLIRAFLRAFRPGDATLTLKLSPYQHREHYSSAEEVILHELCEPDVSRYWSPRQACVAIRVIRQKLTRSEMLSLHANHDVYCSASRGEGLDLPAFAAKLAGRKLCVTDSGGPRDFLAEGDVLVAACGSVPADPSYKWGRDATYADFRLDDVIDGLVRARSTPPVGSRVAESFQAERVGGLFREWVGELCGR